MRNEFEPYEDDFEQWVEGGFAPAAPETQAYLRFLADPDDERRPRPGGLWEHQWQALLRTVYAREVRKRDFWEDGLLLNIVTGGGKTALIAAVMVWLRLAHNVQRFLVLCPNLIVRDRLEADFRTGSVFHDRGLIPPDAIVSADAFALTTLGGQSKATASDLFGANVVLANIHQFYEARAENRYAFLEANRTPFAIFNDEAHNTSAPQYDAMLGALREHEGYSFRLDTTATPDRADEKPIDSRMICEYGVPEALRDGIIAMPVVYQPDIETVELTYTDAQTGETRRVEEIDWEEVDKAGLSATQWVTDAKPMSQQIGIALKRLEEAKRIAAGRYHPILFVVAVCKADAEAAQAMLRAAPFNLRTLIVTEDENECARTAAANIGRSGDYDAVVSVAMLREGWDVPEVSVILLLRKFGSKVYGPQVVGRGLRRVRSRVRPTDPMYIDPHEPQICAVVDHPKLEHKWLWDQLQARVHQNVGVDQEFNEREERGEPPPVQEIVNRDLIIKIPDPIEGMEPELEPAVVEPDPDPARDWAARLAALDDGLEGIEITDVTLGGVIGQELGGDGWAYVKSAPDSTGEAEDRILTREDLVAALRERIRYVAEQATTAAGYPAQMQRHVWGPLRAHVSARYLDGEEIAFADAAALGRALGKLHRLEAALVKRTDIVGGMIEYAG